MNEGKQLNYEYPTSCPHCHADLLSDEIAIEDIMGTICRNPDRIEQCQCPIVKGYGG
ncbi:hypothetical protein [Pelosinus propionicus]|uniref:Uncharacterized protein n=1 Tax=Pelosinus propionicus DSM 13327 TaxID=1123291 RepID=A0A1I4JV21_9FIRM|nr:hypothetical protein [Pelosinus propionicus]SFL70181.1 hypothetical protein SAMN04490355_101431 [Pelosinus propionicus DSM 13327]